MDDEISFGYVSDKNRFYKPKMQKVDYMTMTVTNYSDEKKVLPKVGEIWKDNKIEDTYKIIGFEHPLNIKFQCLSGLKCTHTVSINSFMLTAHKYMDAEPKPETKQDLTKTIDTKLDKVTNDLVLARPCVNCGALHIQTYMVKVSLPSNDMAFYCPTCWNGCKFPENKQKPQTQTSKDLYNSWDPEDDTFLADA